MPELPPPDALLGNEETVKVARIRMAHTKMGHDDWNNRRVWALATMLNVTIYELCAIAGVYDPGTVARHWKRGRWPVTMAIHFFNMQQYFMQQYGRPKATK